MKILLIRAFKIQLFKQCAERNTESKILDNHTTQLQTKVKESKVEKNGKKIKERLRLED